MKEEAVLFGKNNQLVGIATSSKDLALKKDIGVIILNSGILHRVGQNLISVKIARKLAPLGSVCLRFDLSGIGDSEIDINVHSRFERAIHEIAEAIQYLKSNYNVKKCVLVGSCSGALQAARVAIIEKDVIGTVHINISTEIIFRHMLRMHLANLIKNVLVGTLGTKKNIERVAKAIKTTFRNIISTKSKSTSNILMPSKFTYDDLCKLIERKIPTLFLCSQWDPSLDKMYSMLKEINQKSMNLQMHVLKNTAHDLYELDQQIKVIDTISEWFESEILQNNPISIKQINSNTQALSFVKNLF